MITVIHIKLTYLLLTYLLLTYLLLTVLLSMDDNLGEWVESMGVASGRG